ncbi:hypothetical protein [Catenuloplanes atrovinosus]|uniref:Uncharacterized protein n=1 Tax=Catenuloplanes atrovinosus TaxID=137266 RepID=A0AAE3YHJ7_9ACTN|nr:hypothetical protein [Catenuloplanes atrovinosus]MDR7274058.1 hypothetical protein [Catenuloplanes atrovinosus]
MHPAHYLAELQRIVRSNPDDHVDSHGFRWTRRGAELVCESWSISASMCEVGDRLSFRITQLPDDR